MYVLYIVVCPFVLFRLAIVLSVLRYTDSDYPFGIFKLFLSLLRKYVMHSQIYLRILLNTQALHK